MPPCVLPHGVNLRRRQNDFVVSPQATKVPKERGMGFRAHYGFACPDPAPSAPAAPAAHAAPSAVAGKKHITFIYARDVVLLQLNRRPAVLFLLETRSRSLIINFSG